MTKNWLKASREKVGISQEELAARLQRAGFDIARATVGHWEQGKYSPPLENPEFCAALARILNVNVLTLLEMAGFDISDKTHSEAAERIAYLVDQLPPDKQELALRLVEQLVKA